LCFGELGWTRDRYLHATIEEFSEAIKGYWKNWERQRAWIVRELIFAMIAGNPNIEKKNKPKSKEDIFKLSDDRKEVVKKQEPITPQQLEKITSILKH